MDLNLFTPTTSHPPSWCLIHVSHYGTANGGPRSSSFKIHTEVAVVFSSRRFRHRYRTQVQSGGAPILTAPLPSFYPQRICSGSLFVPQTPACCSNTGLRRQHVLCPLIPTLCQFAICCQAVPCCVKRSLTNSLQNTIGIGGVISEPSAYSVVDNRCGF